MLKFQTIYDEVVKRIGHDHSTSNEELERVGIQTIGDKFLGVFASDTFPRATRHETYCIVNLDDSNGAGTHWVARMTKKKDNYWYDSFARSISTIMPRARGVDTDLSPNEHDQHMSQMDCGQRCLAALLCGHRFGIELFKRLYKSDVHFNYIRLLYFASIRSNIQTQFVFTRIPSIHFPPP